MKEKMSEAENPRPTLQPRGWGTSSRYFLGELVKGYLLRVRGIRKTQLVLSGPAWLVDAALKDLGRPIPARRGRLA